MSFSKESGESIGPNRFIGVPEPSHNHLVKFLAIHCKYGIENKEKNLIKSKFPEMESCIRYILNNTISKTGPTSLHAHSL